MNSNWLRGAQECSWELISCDDDEDGEVIQIQLGKSISFGMHLLGVEILSPHPKQCSCVPSVGNNLQGSLPDELRLLTRLLTIDVSLNAIEGSIPSIIAELSNLRVFRSNTSRLSGNLPESLGRATALREFDVSLVVYTF